MPTKLDSAMQVEYSSSHQRLIISLTEAGKLGSKYFLLHSSESTPFIMLGKDLEPSRVVDFWGRPMEKLINDDPRLRQWLLENMEKEFLCAFMRGSPEHYKEQYVTTQTQKFYRELEVKGEKPREMTREEIEKITKGAEEYALKVFIQSTDTSDMSYGTEATAYYIVAKWMELNKDALWTAIAGSGSIDDEKFRKSWEKWVPAVSAKYLWGHFNPKLSDYPNPKNLLEKYNMYFVIETPTGYSGGENLGRFSRPVHMAVLAQNAGTKLFGVAFDFEHVLGNNIDPKDEISKLPYMGGKFVKVIHAGFPTPLHTAHATVEVGSDEHRYLYERLWELRQKGFEDGYIIFERGGGEDPVGQTIIALRLIKEFLEKNTLPKDLPLEFYGVKEEGPELARQELAIKQHALDPLRGMFVVPEEEHGILGKAAIARGKGEEWKKEEYK